MNSQLHLPIRIEAHSMDKPDTYTPMRMRKSAVVVVAMLIAVLTMFNSSPFEFAMIALAIMAAPLSFPYVANRVAPLVVDRAREFLSCMTWFSLWSIGCVVTQSSLGWLMYGLLWALAGGIMMVARTPEEPMPPPDATAQEARKYILRSRIRANARQSLNLPS